MIASLIKQLFFLPELFTDLQNPVRQKYFYKYLKRYLTALYWLVKFNYPSKHLKLIGITGTDGKTTVANLVYHILEKAGKKPSIISTIYGKVGNEVFDTGFHVTTPNAKEIQKYFKQAVRAGSDYFVLESTSHGLDQYRLLGCNFEVGILTNITHEHLDYHENFQTYVEAKSKLFKKSKISILNLDIPVFKKVKSKALGKVITYGFSKEANFNLKNFPFKTRLEGEYNKYNVLAAVAAAKVLGIDDEVIYKAIADFSYLSGRMEEIKNNKGIKLVVDFAHTPNALEQALKTLKAKTSGKLIAVFGAAAERDKEKRPMMGEISSRFSEVTILTDEDPRFEDRNKIIEEIAAGAYKFGAVDNKNLFKEPDRAKAIKLAIGIAKKGDIIGIFGKGHERSMNYKGVEKPWSDQEAAKKALRTQEDLS